MNNVLKFLIKLQASEGNITSVARKVSSQLDRIKLKAEGVGASLRKAFSPSAFGSALMSVPAMQFLTNPYTMVGAGLGAIVKLGSEAQMTAQAFTTLVGSEEKAKAVLADIKAFADKTPFDTMRLTEHAQKMLSFGVSTEQAMTYLKQLGDISGGDSERLSALSLVMGQVSASGKLMGQDLMQFINAGFNPLKELQKMHPEKSYKELQEAMSKGQISADMVASAIAHATSEGGAFFGMMDKLSGTLQGKLSTAIGNLQNMAVNLFAKIEPYVTRVLDTLSGAIPHITRAFEFLFDALIDTARFLKNWGAELMLIGSLVGIVALGIYAKTIALTAYAGVMAVVTTATKLWTGVQWLLNAALTANPIGLVIMGIAALVAAITYCWHKFAGFRAFIITTWDTFKQLGSIIKEYVVNRFNEALEGIGKVGKALKALLSGDFSGAWSSFKEGLAHVAGKNSSTQAIRQTKEAVQGIKGKWQADYSRESRKQAERDKKPATQGIAPPSLKGSARYADIQFGAAEAGGKGAKGGKSKVGDALATGGTRPTTIHVHIGKFFDAMNIQMLDKADTGEIERSVLQALNRSLAIATSTE